MKTVLNLGAASVSTVAAAVVFASPTKADEAPSHRLGDHPAIVVQRLHKAAGYDYESKFYPHPAGLRLYAEPPRSTLAPAAGAPAEAKAPSAERAVAREPQASPKPTMRGGG